MNVPVRCFSCNRVVGNKWYPYQALLEAGKSPKEALDQLGLVRYCCRRMIVSHVEIGDLLLEYSERKPSPRQQEQENQQEQESKD